MADFKPPSSLIRLDDPGYTLGQVIDAHNQAMGAMSPAQLAAINRIVLATTMTLAMVGPKASPQHQAEAAEAALVEVLRNEAQGKTFKAPMWPQRAPRMDADYIDQLARRPGVDTEPGVE